MEAIQQTFNGSVGSRQTATVSRNGDLVGRCYLKVTHTGAATRAAACALVDHAEVEVGGQRVDKQYGGSLKAMQDLYETSDKLDVVTAMSDNTNCYIPLNFWFCRNPGLALPLIALQYHEVKVTCQVNADSNELWVDYVYLDTDERRRFAQTSHEYLIEQLQFTGSESVSDGDNKLRLNFNHPVKELMWVPNVGTCDSAKLQLNGHDRMAEREGAYFQHVQPYQHHTCGGVSGTAGGSPYCYSFALKPEEHQPSGTCNFSRIDNATLNVSTTGAASVDVYAWNYNVLRVMSGMGGLAYSN